MPRRTIEQSPAYTHRERSLARSRLASRHQQLAEPDKSALGNGNLRKGHEAGQDGTIRRKARTKLPVSRGRGGQLAHHLVVAFPRLASRPASFPKVSGSPHQARDAKVDGETPPAAFEARRAHGGTPAPCRRTSPI
ncbi:uncharacterized protein LOC119770063 isoform X1 [Culex quinquefasciatus]|uniref:uncharacterized protein LOC119770063 isoform X1 n=1 Tax=Culex quinquefasciatus TaxID=7176 RepID=UPI0018E372A8|nr:uncharacterized protein LOC119770063 isoform X1 [Culex quinquefasciatus]XP_038120164.1 uncharacterized protein LOC119770063 isoform X1 [Culex quinquefasciatus]